MPNDNHVTAFRCIDDDHTVWQCGQCGFIHKFEADGPFENGWDVCPHCGYRIKRRTDA